MALTQDGNNLVFEGTLTVTNFSNPTAGLVSLILTPSGGVGTIPGLVAGAPGLPPVITLGAVNTLSPGQPATAALTQTGAGGEGVASSYTLVLGLPQGNTGSNGTSGALHTASDVTSGTLAAGVIPVATSATTFGWQSLPFANVYNPSSINNLSESGQTTGLLCSVTVPAQPYNWYPEVEGSVVVSGNTTTVVNVQALLNNASTGNLVGIGQGVAGVANQCVAVGKGFGSLVNATSGYGVVAAGAAATIYFNAVQTAPTSASWSIANTGVFLTVTAQPTAAAT